MDDSMLIKRLKAKETSALEDIIDKYTRLVSAVIGNVACGYLTAEDIEEATEDTFIALWYNAEKIEEHKLKAYLCQIAKNKARDKLRRLDKNNVVSLDSVDADGGFLISDDIEEKTASISLLEAIDEIGEPDREIIIRRYYYYQTSAAIGKIMNMNPQTVRTKISRAKEKLRKLLTERGFTL